jgi:hypothetical protein
VAAVTEEDGEDEAVDVVDTSARRAQETTQVAVSEATTEIVVEVTSDKKALARLVAPVAAAVVVVTAVAVVASEEVEVEGDKHSNTKCLPLYRTNPQNVPLLIINRVENRKQILFYIALNYKS